MKTMSLARTAGALAAVILVLGTSASTIVYADGPETGATGNGVIKAQIFYPPPFQPAAAPTSAPAAAQTLPTPDVRTIEVIGAEGLEQGPSQDPTLSVARQGAADSAGPGPTGLTSISEGDLGGNEDVLEETLGMDEDESEAGATGDSSTLGDIVSGVLLGAEATEAAFGFSLLALAGTTAALVTSRLRRRHL